MKSYIEIKHAFCEIIGSKNVIHINDNDNIVIQLYDYGARRTKDVIIEDKVIREAYESLCKHNIDGMQLYSDNSYEIAMTGRWTRSEELKLIDSDNGITYSLGDSTIEYILMLCNLACEDKALKRNMYRAIRFSLRLARANDESSSELISRIFRVKTLKISVKKTTSISAFNRYSSSFEYLYMYKSRHSVLRVVNAADMFEERSGGRARVGELEDPPRRIVNSELLEYYAMAVDAHDPFTSYISFYHVLEFYFDEVYKRKLLDEMKDKITDPSFSYKNDKKLYDLAKWIGKRMKNDDDSGRGNEFESLKFVLEEYVPIKDLIVALDDWNSSLKDYYQENNVKFSGCNKDKIAWKDASGVYTNLANRIYYTRNSLVHSKSSQVDKLYKPQKHRTELLRELPLIQVIAEIIITKTGQPL